MRVSGFCGGTRGGGRDEPRGLLSPPAKSRRGYYLPTGETGGTGMLVVMIPRNGRAVCRGTHGRDRRKGVHCIASGSSRQ